jgi:hypothetical protein
MLPPLVIGFFSALGAGLAAMVFFEVRGATGWASGRLIKLAANRLPTAMRDDRYEEWLAEYEHWKDGAIGRLLWSLGLVLAAIQIGRRERLSAVQTEQVVPEQQGRHIIIVLLGRMSISDSVFTKVLSPGIHTVEGCGRRRWPDLQRVVGDLQRDSSEQAPPRKHYRDLTVKLWVLRVAP